VAKKKVEIIPTEAIDLGYNSGMVIDGKLWLSGCGNAKTKVVVLAPCPDRKALSYKKASSGQAWLSFYQYIREAGLDPADFYFTYVVKHAPAKAKPSNTEIRECAPYLELELRKVNPSLIICLGSTVWGALKQTKTVNFSATRGTVTDIEYTFTDCEWSDNQQAYEHKITKVPYKALPIFNPEFLDIAPKELPAFQQDLQTLKTWMSDGQQKIYKPEYTLITTVKQIDDLHEAIKAEGKEVVVAIDCEWHGDAWYKDHKLLRMVQLCINGDLTVVVALTGADGPDMVVKIDDLEKARLSLKALLESPLVSIIGQNVKEDALWLKACMDIEIMDKVIFDTMMAEALLNQNGPFGLEDLALKYTDIPRWAIELERWKKTVDSSMHRDGYGLIPDAILEPYGAIDVIATYKVFEAQWPLLDQCGYLESRGEYPSLFANTIQTQIGLFEVETTGLPVDTQMLDKMIELFETKVAKMSAEFIAEAEPLVCQYIAGTESRAVEVVAAERAESGGIFNPDSNADVQQLLFKVLGITPFKTTAAAGGKLWEKAVAELGFDDADAIDELAAATDGDSLTILAEQHPLVEKLLNYRRIAQIRKTWMRYPEIDELGRKSGGLYGDLGSNGRLSPSFLALCSTGRLSTRACNSQNFPKKAQKYVSDAFKEELETDPFLIPYKGKMPGIRNVVVPPPGYVIMEGDFVQAELFVLAALSGDETMWKALNTPGMDLHTKTARDSFKIDMVRPDGTLVEEAEILERAAVFYKDAGGGTSAYDKNIFDAAMDDLYGSLKFRDARHNFLSYKEFKSNFRVSGKSVNFGVPYGRQSLSIAIQIKVETGSKEPLSKIEQDVQKMLHTWKHESYPKAWAYMEQCSWEAMNEWEVKNPWGRSRRFIPTNNRRLLAGYGRQGSNTPIQSTVADTCNIALQLMREERSKRGLSFRACNLVHDAIMALVPIPEIAAMKQLFRDTMGNIKIPLKDREPLILGVDIEVMSRWGVAYKG